MYDVDNHGRTGLPTDRADHGGMGLLQLLTPDIASNLRVTSRHVTLLIMQVMGWMETFEDLASTGFKPTRTIYFAVGADEEVGQCKPPKCNRAPWSLVLVSSSLFLACWCSFWLIPGT